MNEKTVYDELLGYKVKPDDVKAISDLFIDLQEHEVNISLNDLLFFYNKKIKFSRFKELIEEALKNNIEIPTEKIKKVDLTGNDFINLIAGIVSAKKEQLEIKIPDIEYFAKMKINIPELLTSLKKINQYDPDIILNDFAQCQNCLYESQRFVNELIELKKFAPEISLKKLISLSFEKTEATKILNLYKKLDQFRKAIPFTEIMQMKIDGANIIDFLEGLKIAEKNEISAAPEQLIKIARKNKDFKKIMEECVMPDIREVKPVRVILESGLMILLKIKFLLFANPADYLEGMGKEAVIDNTVKFLNETAKDFQHPKTFLINSPRITEAAEAHINNMKPAYNLRGLQIQDYVIDRFIQDDLELFLQQRKIARDELYKAHKKQKSYTHQNDTDQHSQSH